MNELAPEKRGELLALFRQGVGVREAARRIGCHRDTAMRLRKKWTAMPKYTSISGEDYDLLKDSLELAREIWTDAGDTHKVERIDAMIELFGMSRALEYTNQK